MFLSYFLWSVLLTSLTVFKLPDSFQRSSTFEVIITDLNRGAFPGLGLFQLKWEGT